MSPNTKLALLIPVFNDAAGLRASLESLHKADMPNSMITLVVDDGSEPSLDLNMSDFREIRLEVMRLPRNQGIEHALNAGLKRLLTSDEIAYIARLDAGDTINADRLTRQLEWLELHTETVIIGSDVDFVDAAGKLQFRQKPPIDDKGIRHRMHFSSALMHPSVMIRAETLKRIGGAYSAHYPAAEDYELFFRLMNIGQAASIPESLTTCHLSSGGLSAQRRRKQLLSRLRIQFRFFRPMLIESYLGICMTLLLMLTPTVLVTRIKRRLASVPC